MSNDNTEFGACLLSDDAKEAVRDSLRQSQTPGEIWPVDSLGGGEPEYIIAGVASLHALALFLKALYPFAQLRRVKSIKIGDVEIINPSTDDVNRLLSSIETKSRKPKHGNKD